MQSLCDSKEAVQNTACVEVLHLCNSIMLLDPAWRVHASTDSTDALLSTLLPCAPTETDVAVAARGYLPLLPLSNPPSIQDEAPARCPIVPEDILPSVDLANMQVIQASNCVN